MVFNDQSSMTHYQGNHMGNSSQRNKATTIKWNTELVRSYEASYLAVILHVAIFVWVWALALTLCAVFKEIKIQTRKRFKRTLIH